MTPEMVIAIGSALAAIISAFYARQAAVQLPAIHTLVNSQYGASLLTGKVSADLLHEKFPENVEYERLARVATELYLSHARKQSLVDTASVKGPA